MEFSEASEKEIRDAWKTYPDHLNTYAADQIQESDETRRTPLLNQKEERRKDLLAELLQKMGVQLVLVRFHLSKRASLLSSGAWNHRRGRRPAQKRADPNVMEWKTANSQSGQSSGEASIPRAAERKKTTSRYLDGAHRRHRPRR